MATSAHLNIALLQALAGVELNHVPYKGSVAATQALLAGEVQLGFDSVTALLPYARAGRVKALAVSSLARSPVLPELPTLAEQGLSGFDVVTWFGFFTPAGTPSEVIEKLSADTARLLNSAEFNMRLRDLGMQVVGSTPEQLRLHVERELKRWRKVSREVSFKNE
jgi:tripartite-type tricarboxylate transporter receptor subunit TctC